MKILILTQHYYPQLEYQENLLARALARRGCEIVVVSGPLETTLGVEKGSRAGTRQESLDGAVRVIRLPYRFHVSRRFFVFAGLDRVLDDESPDGIVLHDVSYNLSDIGRFVSRNRQGKVLMTFHTDFSNSGRTRLSLTLGHRILRRHFVRRLDPLLVAYLPVTPDSLRFLVHVHGIDPQKTQLQPITVDVDAINSQQTTESRRRWRRALGVEETSLLVFTGGRLEPRKKTELLIRALNQPGLQGLNLAIVGQSGREHQEYFGHLRDVAGGSERIHFLGWRSTEEVHEIMGASDIAVFPASQSVLWQKAVGSGLPLIAGAMPGQDPSYMDLGNIMILRGEEISEQGVRNALRVLSRNPELRGEMSRAARKITKQLLDVEIAAERIVRILR